jgi:hypothetical protein
MRPFRLVLFLALLACGYLGGDVAPARAQVMKPDGIALPWFRSPAERRAREACEQNLPECRASVRQQIADEKAASMITPWLILGVGILVALLWLRVQEKKKLKKRASAQRRHNPETFRKLDRAREERPADRERMT